MGRIAAVGEVVLSLSLKASTLTSAGQSPFHCVQFYIIVATNFRLSTIGKLIPLVLTLFCSQYENYEARVLAYISTFNHNVAHQGLETTVYRYKSVRLAVLRYLSGNPLYELEGVALDSSGFPKELSQWKDDLDNPQSIRILLTLLTLGRAFKFKAILKLSTIEEPSKGIPQNEDTIKVICRSLGVYPQELSWTGFHFSTKSGPNGPALATSLTDLDALTPLQKEDIILLGGLALQVAMTKPFQPTGLGYSMMEIWRTIHSKPLKYTRKLSYFSDKEGKSRVIAILDYWTQSALKPLHEELMGILKRIPSDCTFNQDDFLSSLPSVGPYFCFDLSAATDRMPVDFQVSVLSNLIGKEKAEAWKRLLVGEPFANKDCDHPVYYRAGQPMGAYSSWAAMALSHHVMVQLSAINAKVIKPSDYFPDYCLLGDDLVIANREVALQYKILCSKLDMPISEEKTLISETMLEFAKRIVINGVEVTGFSIGGLLETWKKYSLLHEFLRNQASHGWDLPISVHPDLIRSIFGLFKRYAHAERIIKLYMVYHYITNFISKVTDEEAIYVDRINAGHSLRVSVQQYFQRTFPLWEFISTPEMMNLLIDYVKEIKLKIAVSDVEKLFENRDSIVKTMDDQALKHFPSLNVQLYQALRRETLPVISVCNDLLRLSVDAVNRLVSDEDVDIFSLGISKYYVGEAIFSLRRARSISLAQARLTKQLLDVWQDRFLESQPMYQYIEKYTGFVSDSKGSKLSSSRTSFVPVSPQEISQAYPSSKRFRIGKRIHRKGHKLV